MFLRSRWTCICVLWWSRLRVWLTSITNTHFWWHVRLCWPKSAWTSPHLTYNSSMMFVDARYAPSQSWGRFDYVAKAAASAVHRAEKGTQRGTIREAWINALWLYSVPSFEVNPGQQLFTSCFLCVTYWSAVEYIFVLLAHNFYCIVECCVGQWFIFVIGRIGNKRWVTQRWRESTLFGLTACLLLKSIRVNNFLRVVSFAWHIEVLSSIYLFCWLITFIALLNVASVNDSFS